MKHKSKSSWLLLITVVLYFAGLAFIKPTNIEFLKNTGIAQQEEYIYENEFGDEYESETLIDIKGIGKVLTYKDVYFAAIPMFLISIIMGMILFGNEKYENAIIANGVLGLLLIWITSKGTVIATILYWLSFVSFNFILKIDKKDN